MGRVVVTEFISLDGVIQAPGDPSEYERGGWAQGGGDASMQFKFEELMASDQLLGRKTYEGFAAAWPTTEGTGVFGEKMNEMPKFVASNTLRDPTWNNTTVLQGTSSGRSSRSSAATSATSSSAAAPSSSSRCSSWISSTSCT